MNCGAMAQTTETEFDFTATYIADGWAAGIAWRATEWEEEADEDTEWSGYKVKTGRIVAHMVGDDSNHTFDPADLTAIDEDAYCSCCGQVGCPWG
jgi:hypothetical protein